MSGCHWWYLSTSQRRKELRLYTWLRIRQFQTPAEKLYLQMHHLAELLIFGVMIGAFERESEYLFDRPIAAS
jgi:hypothetical protein